MKAIVTLLLAFSPFLFAHAQTAPCEVAVVALKGAYTGACSDGKAHGEGKATGTDSYTGTFKNGYPDGSGTYTWKNGDYYTGQWKKGKRDGTGELHTVVNGNETITNGFWKKDEYKGKYQKPFVIHNTTSDIGRVEVNKIKGTRLAISIEVQSISGGASLTDIRLLGGSFTTQFSNKLGNKEITSLQGVIFPFRAVFVFGNSQVDIEILEEGEWTIGIPIQK